MKNFQKLACISLLFLFLSGAALADKYDGWERASRFNSFFDQESLVYITGKVTDIDRTYKPIDDMTEGFAITVQTDDEKNHLVVVGPVWFTHFYKQKWDISIGDRVDVRGSEVNVDGKPMIMAIWGRKDDLEMTVRSRTGRPVWDLGIEEF